MVADSSDTPHPLGDPARPRLGVLMPPFPADADGDDYAGAARQIEDLGFDSLFCGDHVVTRISNPDALTLLAGLATVTRRIRLGTAVLLVALREPVVTAKQVATLDQLTRGRLVLGVGVGGEVPGEWEAVGVPMASRGRRTDEYLELMQKLWSGHAVDHQGELRTVVDVIGTPLPAQAGGPPIWVGGRSDRAIERALRFDGWCAYATSTDSLARRVSEIRDRSAQHTIAVVVFTCVAQTRSQARIRAAEVVDGYYGQDWTPMFDRIAAVGTRGEVADRLAAYFDAGADEVLVCPTATEPSELADQLDAIADLDVRASISGSGAGSGD